VNILYLSAHSILEYDEVRLFTDLGHDVFSPGAYIRGEGDGKRPSLPITIHPELIAAMEQAEGGAEVAKGNLPDLVLDWADTIICSAFEHTYIVPQWSRLAGKRVIWRTIGQSVAHNEAMMAPLRAEGLEIVRYSPKERNIPGFAGEDALIRFYKDPADYGGWTGEGEYVLGFGQHYVHRDPWTNYRFFAAATRGLPTRIIGPGSEEQGGPGEVSFDGLRDELRKARVLLYTGTQPAPYTLGLIEAMMTGTPVVSIGPAWFDIFPYGPEMFEGREIAIRGSDDPKHVRRALAALLEYRDPKAPEREIAIRLFGRDTITAQWREYFG
jgi:hypothetical protein